MRGWEGTMKWGSCSNWLGLGLNLKHDKTTGWRINLNSFRRFLGQSTETSAPAARVHSQHVVQSLVLFNYVLGGDKRVVHYHTPWTSGTPLGDRNGRRNMTYQKFSRALRYYYNKKVMLTKIRGQKYTYKFDFQELERQYGYRGISSVTFHQPTGNSQYMIPSVTAYNCDAFPASHPQWGSFHNLGPQFETCRKRIRQI